jgi:hypothetical protein
MISPAKRERSRGAALPILFRKHLRTLPLSKGRAWERYHAAPSTRMFEFQIISGRKPVAQFRSGAEFVTLYLSLALSLDKEREPEIPGNRNGVAG